ncbi:hypothetical protein AVEN_140989-1 [Araneus ventricosus]|uniref:Uncharacterized protein n=1 Tax=Araneus ventricosus TaxID=182803 RepID=A0A4Y2S3S2_ARAVE|nr:hypothetical protein AVEN_140989-1 [Araneus ventricosus]
MTRKTPELAFQLSKISAPRQREGGRSLRMIYTAIGAILVRVSVELGLDLEPRARKRDLTARPPRVFLQLQASWHPQITLFYPSR